MRFSSLRAAQSAALGAALLLPLSALSADFLANPDFQRQAPGAFALQAETQAFLRQAHPQTRAQGEALVNAIQQDTELRMALSGWEALTMEERLPWLVRVHALESEVLGITPPKLVVDTESYPGKTVFFDFSQPGPGVVYLNPDKLAQMPPYASLAFVIHETRHSYQLQWANAEQDVLAEGYRAAFDAQSSLSGFGFSDFLTLLNEYEAFQFGNYVLGRLTNWQVSMLNMGTYASQFDGAGQLKLDLLTLPAESRLDGYNKVAEQQQADLKGD